jgi:hypothetical protein
MEGLFFEAGAVAWDEKPVADLLAQKLDGTEGREFSTELRVGGVGAIGKNEPKTVVLGRFGAVPEHADDAVTQVDSKTGKHPAHLGIQRRECLHDKCVRRLLFGFGGAKHDRYTKDGNILAQNRRRKIEISAAPP